MGRLDLEKEFNFYKEKYPYDKSALYNLLDGKDFNDVLNDRERLRKKELIKFERLEQAYREKIENLEMDIILKTKMGVENQKDLKKLLMGIIEVLDIVDDFKEFLLNREDEHMIKAYDKTLKSINKRINYIGLEKIKTVSEQFNEDFHYCVEVIERNDYDNETIIEEVKSGYRYKGNVVRESKVVVIKNEGSI